MEAIRGSLPHKETVRKRYMSAMLAIAALGMVGSVSGCGETSTRYDLQNIGGKLIDTRAGDGKSVEFYYDSGYGNGSIAAEVCTTDTSIVRFVSKEDNPNPRYTVDVSYPVDGKNSEGCAFKHPVDNLHVGDVEEVYVGMDSKIENTYNSMRRYRFTYTASGLRGEALGTQMLNPQSIQPQARRNVGPMQVN